MQVPPDPVQEKSEILKRYRSLLRACPPDITLKQKRLIRKAFNFALEAHKDMRRKTGEPYIYHPIEVARICLSEIGLGTTSAVCSLLHDVVEDTDYTLDDISVMFGEKVAKIIDGLTKISEIFDKSQTTASASLQAENFKKILLTLSDDVRVILIKLADRLHNMRTLDALSPEKRLKISSETLYLYAPLAHRLGLFTIKSELEELCLKYTEPDVYKSIIEKLKKTKAERIKFTNDFVAPIEKELKQKGFNFKIISRTKSIYSIWQKMSQKQIPFEEVYDLFAVRIIIDTAVENEKVDCWRVYSIVTDFYRPNPDRLRDWISIPKANGYESLHLTVMSKSGRWIEVQIRTKRMDDIAEKGFAAHWKYKESVHGESSLDKWISRIRDLLQNSESNALDFLDDFKMNLFSDEIFAFTPKGELRTLPNNSTALDFAYSIHSHLGNTCIGAKVNHQLVPLNYQLRSGDQIEIITSDKQTPKEEWFGFVATARAKGAIKLALRKEKVKVVEKGKEVLSVFLKQMKLEPNTHNFVNLQKFYNIDNTVDLFYDVAIGKIGYKEIKEFANDKERGNILKFIKNTFIKSKDIKEKTIAENIIDFFKSSHVGLLLGEKQENLSYTLATCCEPIHGDEVIGYKTTNEGIKIHRTNCPEAIQLMSKYGNRIVKAKWTNDETIEFLAGLKFYGIDKVGILNMITNVISVERSINIQSITFDTNKGVFEGMVKLYIQDTVQLNILIDKLKKVEGIEKVYRISRS